MAQGNETVNNVWKCEKNAGNLLLYESILCFRKEDLTWSSDYDIVGGPESDIWGYKLGSGLYLHPTHRHTILVA